MFAASDYPDPTRFSVDMMPCISTTTSSVWFVAADGYPQPPGGLTALVSRALPAKRLGTM